MTAGFRGSSRRRPGWLVVAALLLCAATVYVVHLSAGSSSPASAASSSDLNVAGPTAPALRTTSALSSTVALVATAPQGVRVYRRPGGSTLRGLSGKTSLGSVRTLLVVARRNDGWLRVQLPTRPNESTGWVKAGAVRLSSDPWSITISRNRRMLVLRRAGKVIRRYSVAVGSPATPTPAGLFSVTDKVLTGDPAGAFGAAALGLSAHSTVLRHFDGGDGVIGVHGTNADWSVGHPISHGCIRLHDDELRSLYRRVPLGTPVRIT